VITLGVSLAAFGIFALSLESFEVALVSFGLAGWLMS
jgi:hypothetical protein